MSALPGHLSSKPMQESSAARELRLGSKLLRFADAPLENRFQQNHWQNSRSSVHLNVWLAIAMVASFILLDYLVLARRHSLELQLVRMAVLVTLGISAAITSARVAKTGNYHRLLQCLAPFFGLCVVANDLIAMPQGISFFPAIVLTVFGIYLLLGLLFVPALLSGIFVLAAYVAGAWHQHLPVDELIYNTTVLLFSNGLGATACYSLERLRRRAFLETLLLSEMANRDGLTGIYNRRAFDENLNRLWQEAVREQRPLALLLVDIDHFKAYNDYYGHQAGDQCLQQVAHILMHVCRRPLDFTARYGGEEFAIVLYDARREYVEELAANIQSELRQLGLNHPASPVAQLLTLSIGAVYVVPDAQRTLFGFVQLADEALYAAKDAGRDRIIVKAQDEYADMTTGAFRHPGGWEQRRVS